MKKYLKIFQNRLAVGLEYRSNIISTLILDLISLGGVIVLWFAVYREHSQISGYNFHDAILYYLLVPFIGSFTYVLVSEELGYEIREGALTNYLLKPFNLEFDALCRAVASKINFIFVTLPVYAIILGIFMYFYGFGEISPRTIVLATITIIAGFLLHFTFDLAMTWLAFWIGDVWTFKHIKSILFLVFGGMVFPLEFITGSLKIVFDILPFKYMYYIPTAYLLGKRGLEDLGIDFLGVVIWSGILLIVSQALWRAGIKKFEAYGG